MSIKRFAPALLVASIAAAPLAQAATTVTIGTVNNGDMVRMQGLSKAFEETNPDIKLKWVVLEENVLRQRLTTDIATKGGQFDVMTIGMYEAPIWGAKGWLTPMDNLPADYNADDIFPAIRDGLSHDNTLYALPFYGESSMTYYRKDLFEAKGLTMPNQPTWDEVKGFAKAIHSPKDGMYGICLRGKAGWGENMALVSTMGNTFGARWFDEQWKSEFTGEAWTNAVSFYVDLLGNYGPPGAASNGFNENLALFNSGKCGMWIDATVAGAFVTDKSQSKIADNVGFSLAPQNVTKKGAGWLWSWALAVPKTSDATEAARKFVLWATSTQYSDLVAKTSGIATIPPGTRKSTYENAEYITAAPFASKTLEAMKAANPKDSTVKSKPYIGVQFAAIPEFQSIASQVGKFVSGALAGSMTVEEAMKNAVKVSDREMKRAGYFK